jgi:hypothetical protein
MNDGKEKKNKIKDERGTKPTETFLHSLRKYRPKKSLIRY